jgi:hypothetical protein
MVCSLLSQPYVYAGRMTLATFVPAQEHLQMSLVRNLFAMCSDPNRQKELTLLA